MVVRQDKKIGRLFEFLFLFLAARHCGGAELGGAFFTATCGRAELRSRFSRRHAVVGEEGGAFRVFRMYLETRKYPP